VLAKIHGFCMGGGIALAASCDVCIASDNAVFRMPAARLGVGYWFNGIERLVHVLGPRNAADIFFSARKFDAHEALRMGLLTRVVPRAEMDSEFARYCATLGDNAPLTMNAAKAAILASLQDSEKRDMAALEKQILGCWASDDYREGRDAFLQKRRPKFSGT
jgi:enoyl-CoA hydratase/carnithine racemase